jgi:hypothetical protein
MCGSQAIQRQMGLAECATIFWIVFQRMAMSTPPEENQSAFYRQLGSLQLLLALKRGSTISLPQILFPARRGFFL